MEFVDDKDDIMESLKALDHIKDWAREQMGSLRRPNPQSSEPEGEAEPMGDEMDEGMGHNHDESGEMGEPEAEINIELEQPMDEPPPRQYGPPKKADRKWSVLEDITPGAGARPMAEKGGESEPPPEFDMKNWAKQTTDKMDKLKKKRPTR
jgi:hypothetical protein